MNTAFEILVARRIAILILAGFGEDEAARIAAEQARINLRDRAAEEVEAALREDAA
jgi:hypothetical protein